MPAAKGKEKLEFVKFEPGPKGEVQYTDFKDCFELHNPQVQVATGQGDGAGARLHPLMFQFNTGIVNAETFLTLVRDNQKTKITSLQYTSTQVYNGKREKKADIKYSVLTLTNITTSPAMGEEGVTVMLTVDYEKAKGSIKQYSSEGKVEGNVQVNIDISKGTYS